jgi:hypothetical protein
VLGNVTDDVKKMMRTMQVRMRLSTSAPASSGSHTMHVPTQGAALNFNPLGLPILFQDHCCCCC